MARPTGDSVTPRLFGWCSTKHHDRCRVTYKTQAGVQRTCECPCHEEVHET